MPNAIKKILVAEDEKSLSKALQLKLTHAGFEVKQAFDGEEAQKALKDDTFDFMLLDLMMPKVNGFDVLKFIKDNKIKTPVVVLSNLGQGEDMQKVKDLGALDYFVKSNTSLADIVSYIEKHI